MTEGIVNKGEHESQQEYDERFKTALALMKTEVDAASNLRELIDAVSKVSSKFPSMYMPDSDKALSFVHLDRKLKELDKALSAAPANDASDEQRREIVSEAMRNIRALGLYQLANKISDFGATA